jgi:hypothetical protein
MCHLCTLHGAVVQALFHEAAGKIAAPPRTPSDAHLAVAMMLICEAQTEDEEGIQRDPLSMARKAAAADALKSLTPEQRSHALHFLSTLRRLTAMAGNTLGIVKHSLNDPDAEEKAPGLGTAAAAAQGEGTLAVPVNPLRRPGKGKEWQN